MSRELSLLKESKEELTGSNTKLQRRFDTELKAQNAAQQQED